MACSTPWCCRMDCIQVFLDEVARRHADEHIVLVLAGIAAWPCTLRPTCACCLCRRMRPSSTTSSMWDELREKYSHNRVFDSLDALEDHLVASLCTTEKNTEKVRSIVAWPWVIDALRKMESGSHTSSSGDACQACRRKSAVELSCRPRSVSLTTLASCCSEGGQVVDVCYVQQGHAPDHSGRQITGQIDVELRTPSVEISPRGARNVATYGTARPMILNRVAPIRM